jgi:predicted enzyme related to lactoylglutathione lyase
VLNGAAPRAPLMRCLRQIGLWETPMKVIRTYFMLMVTDMGRAASFYKRAFGLGERFQSPDWTELDSSGTTVALHGGRREGVVETGLGFEVDDIEAACVRVREAGGTIVEPPRQQEDVDLRLATAADTEGNTFSIVETG